jgi:anti-sigma regulatory factor (Ser/Thr protein kinase)
MILRLTLDLPEDKSYMATTRLLSRTLLEYHNVLRVDIDDTIAIIDELCTNVVRHAQSKCHCFTVTVEYYSERVSIDVIDHGLGLQPDQMRAVGAARMDADGEERFGGFGVPLVRALSDRLEFRDTDPHGTTVHAEKHLRYETARDKRDAVRMERVGNHAAGTCTERRRNGSKNAGASASPTGTLQVS